MTRQHTDLWAPLPGFEPYQRPPDEKFDTVDTQAHDLSTFLRGELDAMSQCALKADSAFVGPVRLADGRPAQISRTADGGWQLMIHTGRGDYYEIYVASTRDGVIRQAN